MKFVGPDGEPAEAVYTVDAKVVNDFAGSRIVTGGLPGWLPQPVFQDNRYRLGLELSGPLDTNSCDTVTVVLEDTYSGALQHEEFIETDADSKVFSHTDDYVEVPMLTVRDYSAGEEIPDVLTLDLDPDPEDPEGKKYLGVKVERAGETFAYRTPVIRCHMHLGEPDAGGLRQIEVYSLWKDEQELPPEIFAETDVGSGVFLSESGALICLVQTTELLPTLIDSLEIALTSEDTGIVGLKADLVETGANTKVFVTPRPGVGGFRRGTDPTPDFPESCVFKIIVQDPRELTGTHAVFLFGDIGEEFKKVIGKLALTKVAPGCYETKKVVVVREREELSDEALAQLGEEYEFVPGEGSGAVVYILGGVALVEAWNIGDAVVDDMIIKRTNQKAKKKVNTRIFRILESCSIMLGGIDWDDYDDIAEGKGWKDSDINVAAERKEILKDLRHMDGDDILVYNGHTRVTKMPKEENPYEDARDAFGLSGYDSFGKADPISIEELDDFMADKGPGVVIINGCASFLDPLKNTFVQNGTRVYIGWSQNIASRETARSVRELLTRLLDGETVQSAVAGANENCSTAFAARNARRVRDEYEPVRLQAWVFDDNLNRSMYAILGLPGPKKQK